MKLSTKNILGFGLILALLVVVAVVAFTALRSASDGFTEYRGLARDTNLAGRLQANMLMVRLNVKDFIISGSEEDARQYAEYFDIMSGFIEDSQQQIQQPERAALIDKTDTTVRQYGQAFDSVEDLMGRRNTLYAALNATGPPVETNLTQIMLSAQQAGDAVITYESALALRHLLLVRLYMMKFLEDNSRSSAERADEEMAGLEEQLAILDSDLRDADLRENLKTAADYKEQYKAAYTELVDVIFNRNTIIDGTLDVLGPQVAAYVEDVKLSVKADQDALGPQLQAANDRAVLLVLLVGILAIIAGILLAVFITISILRQLGVDPSEIARIADEIAGGNLTIRFDSRKNAVGVYHSLKQMTEKLTDVVGNVIMASENVTSGSQQLSDSATELSQGATEQAANAEEISSSLEEVGANIQQNASNASETEKIAREAARRAEEGSVVVNEAVEAMNEIAVKINVIEDIARSTNMLSLNAAIEAARAGEHGKGFAVVAAEVGKLAANSQKAAGEILNLAQSTVSKADEAGSKIQAIVPDIQRTADLVSEINASSAEMNSGVGQINEAMLQLDQVIQQNASASEESSSMSEELTAQARLLFDLVSFFSIDKNTAGASQSMARPAAALNSGRASAALPSPDRPRKSNTAPVSSAPKPDHEATTERGAPEDQMDADFGEF